MSFFVLRVNLRTFVIFFEYQLLQYFLFSSTAFAKPGKYTITTNDPSKQHIIGHGDNYPGFSQTDIQQIGLMYNHICNYNGRK